MARTKQIDRRLAAVERSLGWRRWKHLPLSQWPFSALLSLQREERALNELSDSQLAELLAALSDAISEQDTEDARR
jgi:hypothetical protein